MKRLNFAWLMVIFMAIMAALIFINRVHRFFDPRSGIGYAIYILFILAGILVVLGIILTILNYYRSRGRSTRNPPTNPDQELQPKYKDPDKDTQNQ